MPSTYTLNNGIELIATGEQSGTWGDTTNTNLSLLDTALDGQVTVTLPSAGTSGSPNTLAIADGSASDGRNRMVIFNDGGDLGATAYVQLTPNDAEKIIYIRNDLAGSRSIILFQGTYNASNDYEVPAGTTAVVYFDGAGSGAVAANVFNNAYFDSLRLGGVSVTAIIDDDTMATASATNIATSESIKAYVDTQVGANNELSEVLANGNTSGGNAIQMTTTDELQFRDTALKISSSADGQLDIDADTEIEIVAPTVDIDASTAMTIDTAALTVTGAVDLNTSLNVDGTVTADGLTIQGNTSLQGGTVTINNNGQTAIVEIGDTDDAGIIKLMRNGFNYIDTPASAGSFNVRTSPSLLRRMSVDNAGDITFFDTSGNASFVYDESAGSVFNEQGDNKDFRVESDTSTHTLFVDAGNNRIGVNTSGPLSIVHIRDGDPDLSIEATNTSATTLGDKNSRVLFRANSLTGGNGGEIVWATADDANRRWAVISGHIETNTGSNSGGGIMLGTKGSSDTALNNRLWIKGGGEAVFNEGGADYDFRVESDTNTHALVVDAQYGSVGIKRTSPSYDLDVNASFRTVYSVPAYSSTTGTGASLDYWKLGTVSNLVGSRSLKIRILGTSSYSPGNIAGETTILFRANNSGTTTNGTFWSETSGNNHVAAVAWKQTGTNDQFDIWVKWASSFAGTDIFVETPAQWVFDITNTGSTSQPAGSTLISARKATYTGDRLALNLQSSEVAINDTSNDMDFRVESDTNANALFVDASANKVIVGGTSYYGGTPAIFGVNGHMDIGTTSGNAWSLAFAASQTVGSMGTITSKISGFSTMSAIQLYANNVTGGSQAASINFYTTNSATQRNTGRFINEGAFQVSNDGTYRTWSGNITGNQFINNQQNMVTLTGDATSTAFTSQVLRTLCNRSQNAGYHFLTCTSGNLGDDEFRLRGDGQAYADGSWNGGGADYAEYFETTTGAAIPRGTTVVLEGNKVRAATADDPASAIIGVIRPKEDGKISAMVGNTAWARWAEKYLTDDFGVYLMEDHNVIEWEEEYLDDEGETRKKSHSYESHNIPDGITVPEDATIRTHDAHGKKFQHRQLNPDYDPTLEYVSREDRDEWVIVGLLGQVRILSGQPVGERWTKMKDISATVEEWFIR